MNWLVLVSIAAAGLALAAGTGADPGGHWRVKSRAPGSGEWRPEGPVALEADPSVRDSAACVRLARALERRFPGRAGEGPRQAVRAGLAASEPGLAEIVRAASPALPGGRLPAQGFVLETGSEGAAVAGADSAGIRHGMDLLAALLEEARQPGLPAARIADWPELPRRGCHVLVHGRPDLPILERLITRHLPALRINELILEINYRFQYNSHPEVVDGDPLTRADCRGLRSLADRHGIRLVPMINCLGHQSWAKETFGLLRAHPEMDETPDLPKDNPGIYCRSWCPSHPDVAPLVNDLCDELIDAFQADGFHVGMDEVFILGECPRCRGKDPAALFAKSVNDLHAHLVGRRKVEMQMWGDRLLDASETGYSKWEASANGTAPAAGMIPKDIVVCDWHYGVQEDYPSIKLLQSQGFRVWPAGWDTPENARNLILCGLRSRTPLMIGYLATTWHPLTRIEAALEGRTGGSKEDQKVAGIAAALREGARLAWEGPAQ